MNISADLPAMNKLAVEAARRHMNEVAILTILVTFGLAAIYLANFWLLVNEQIPLWLGCGIFGLSTYMAYTPLHEAVHGNINGGKKSLQWLNNLCGYIAGQLTFLPYSTHRPEHLAHHRDTNHPEKDPDYLVHTMGDGPIAIFVAVLKFLWAQLSFMPKHQWADATWGQRSAYMAEIGFAVGWRVVLISQLPVLSSVMLFVVTYLIAGAALTYWFAYRPHHPYREQARYRNTNSLIMPAWLRPIEWLWMGQNLHSIHHLFPRVPFYKYHALHREIEPIMRAHGTPIIGIYSREEVLKATN